MKLSLLLPSVLAVLSLSAMGAETGTRSTAQSTNLVTRVFDVMPVMIGCRFPPVGGETNRVHDLEEQAEQKSSDLKDFYADFGMTWPEGSSIRHLASMGKLIVRNTPENTAICEHVLLTLNVVPNQIDIEVQFVEFALSDIEVLARKGLIDSDSLMQLRRTGKGKLLCAPKVVTQSDCVATVEGVTEYPYPIGFPRFQRDSHYNGVGIGYVPGPEPDGLETRDVGTVLQVCAGVSSDGACINLTLTPEVVNDPVWRNHGPQNATTSNVQVTANMPMPFFYTQTLTQSLSLFNGATVLAGGGIPGKEKDRVMYVFVSAEQVDTEGNPLHTRRNVVPEAGERP